MNKGYKNFLIYGGIAVGAFVLYRWWKKKQEVSSSMNDMNFSNLIGTEPIVTNQIPSGFSNYIAQYVTPNADQYGKKWYAFIFSNTPQRFVGNEPNSSNVPPVTNSSVTNLNKLTPCQQFLIKRNQISLQYPNLQGFNLNLYTYTQIPTNLCGLEWWWKNMFGSEYVAPKTSATYTNESQITTKISQLKSQIANLFPNYRIAIVRAV